MRKTEDLIWPPAESLSKVATALAGFYTRVTCCWSDAKTHESEEGALAMARKILASIVVVVFAVIGSVIGRSAVEKLLGKTQVPASVLTEQWPVIALGDGGFTFESPWSLKADSMELPAEVRKQLEKLTTLAHESQGVYVFASYMQLPAGKSPSLQGAVDRSIAEQRKSPGTLSVSATQRSTTISGVPAIEVDATIQFSRSGDGIIQSFTVCRENEMFSVILGYPKSEPLGQEIWQKMRKSMALRPKP